MWVKGAPGIGMLQNMNQKKEPCISFYEIAQCTIVKIVDSRPIPMFIMIWNFNNKINWK